MPQQRMDIRMIKDILRLKYHGGLSHERIAQRLNQQGVATSYGGRRSYRSTIAVVLGYSGVA